MSDLACHVKQASLLAGSLFFIFVVIDKAVEGNGELLPQFNGRSAGRHHQHPFPDNLIVNIDADYCIGS